MKITQLGNGGGFDYNSVNSAFLIETGDEHSKNYILVDCGYNVFSELRRMEDEEDFPIQNINTIIVTHHHSDHIGSLEMLCQYLYFGKGNKNTEVFLPEYMKDKYFIPEDINKRYISHKEEYSNIVKVSYLNTKNQYNFSNGIKFSPFKINHATVPGAFGYIFKYKEYTAIITGDTKAYYKIQSLFDKCSGKVLVFHDYSNWNDVSKNIHCCDNDYNSEYSQEFREYIIKYHTGEQEFKKIYTQIDFKDK